MVSLTFSSGSFAEDGNPRELDALIDALASRNPPPKVDNKGAEGSALFDERYDWEEQDRVVKALGKLIAAEGAELWPRLVERMNDKRYSLTYEHDGYVINATIGQLCRELALGDLLWPYWQHMPTMQGVSRQSQYWELRAPQMDLQHGLEAWAWYRSRRGDKLRDLQIEVCNWALKRAPALHEIPEHQLVDGVVPLADEQKEEAVREIKSEIKKLMSGDKPIVGTPLMQRLNVFTPLMAAQAKARYDQKQAERE